MLPVMKSPFPGMDPYLETRWEGVHQTLTVYARDAIQPQLPEDLWALAQDRVYVESEGERIRHIVPDAHVSRIYPPPKPQVAALREGAVAVAEPVVFEVQEPLVTESYISIQEPKGGKVITVIEFLSIANKSGGVGEAKYLEEQAEVLRSDASLVELDLVRAGRRVLALPHYEIPAEYRGDYLACISPGWKRNRRELYPMPLRQRLPILPIPLRPDESRVQLDLQSLVDQAYRAGRYDRLNYREALETPLPPEDAAWVEALLKAAGRR
jgi:hypothetical protein